MHISEIIKKGYDFSFEIIPPRNGTSINGVYKIIDSIVPFKPAFISVTHGAGGSLRGGTAGIVRLLKEHYNIEPLAHLTCATLSKQALENILMDLRYLEIENILALRGDSPDGEEEYKPGEKMHAEELAKQIRLMNEGYYLNRKNESGEFELRNGEKSNFCIAVAGYPEGHKYCKNLKKDIDFLKRKVDQGASFIITQMVFDAFTYNRFVELCTIAGINIPIIPGIMPIRSLKQIDSLERKFSVTVPEKIKSEMKRHEQRPEYMEKVGIMNTAMLMMELKLTAKGLHIYTMNKVEAVKETLDIYKMLTGSI